MSIINGGVQPAGMSCLTAAKLYRTIVLPTSLYGAELWSKLSQDDTLKLERAHNFCLKIIQKFPVRTKTVIAQSMLNMYSLESYIHIRKLQFFGRLCRLHCKHLAKKVFLERLFQSLDAGEKSFGFIPDVVKLIGRYSLDVFVTNYLENGTFPAKKEWKSIINNAIKTTEGRRLLTRFQDPKLQKFQAIYGQSLHVHPIWKLEHTTRGNHMSYKGLAKLNCVVSDHNVRKLCTYCDKCFVDHLEHYINSCCKYEGTRELFWCVMLNTFSVEVSAYLHNLSDSDLACIMLGKKLLM
jgi:hypothetical protein